MAPKWYCRPAWLKDGFERQAESLDISTPLGAWHYATVPCRIALMQSERLLARYRDVHEELIASQKKTDGGSTKKRRITQQRDELVAAKEAVRPPSSKDLKSKNYVNPELYRNNNANMTTAIKKQTRTINEDRQVRVSHAARGTHGGTGSSRNRPPLASLIQITAFIPFLADKGN
ncbi:hypothetical protein SCP_0302180 [Sparassis crispa]|uniref:Uncharacterized protein n=1 Tax=Sparassis crispa TaxID=139825 RepID=A0A401GEH3_9APHY|nr:hypothetical protein SCP_0302180 [Sparassis crispa]GBE80503.1 hypothetical protein SCP_0302180 [Sparassis crispa]